MEKENKNISNEKKKENQKKINKITLIIVGVILIAILLIIGISLIANNIKEKQIKELEQQNERTVPNVVGMTRKEAIEELDKNDLDHLVSPWDVIADDALVISQEPEPNTKVQKGEQVEIKLRKENIEDSDVSFTGMRFKTNWSDLKDEIDNYNSQISNFIISDWETSKPYGEEMTNYTITFSKYRNATIAESLTGAYATPYKAFSFEFAVEDKSDKVVSVSYIFLNTEKFSEYMGYFIYYLSKIDDTLETKIEDFMYQLSNAVSQNKDTNDIDICTFYRDNIFLNISALNSTSTAISVCPASEEEVNYVKENGHWRNFE